MIPHPTIPVGSPHAPRGGPAWVAPTFWLAVHTDLAAAAALADGMTVTVEADHLEDWRWECPECSGRGGEWRLSGRAWLICSDCDGDGWQPEGDVLVVADGFRLGWSYAYHDEDGGWLHLCGWRAL